MGKWAAAARRCARTWPLRCLPGSGPLWLAAPRLPWLPAARLHASAMASCDFQQQDARVLITYALGQGGSVLGIMERSRVQACPAAAAGGGQTVVTTACAGFLGRAPATSGGRTRCAGSWDGRCPRWCCSASGTAQHAPISAHGQARLGQDLGSYGQLTSKVPQLTWRPVSTHIRLFHPIHAVHPARDTT